MIQGFARVAIGQMADSPATRFVSPTRSRHNFAVIGAIAQEEMNFVRFIRRCVLPVRSEEVTHPLRDGMMGIDDFRSEPFQRAMSDVASADQLKVRSVVRIEAH